MSKNYIPKSFLFVFVISLLFSLLSLIDYEGIDFPITVKPVQFFSDILVDTTVHDNGSASQFFDPQPKYLVDSVLADSVMISMDSSIRSAISHQSTLKLRSASIEPIQNFSKQDLPLHDFFDKLSKAKLAKSKVRIAWFGDSFTDADIVVGDLRDTLQSVYGGNGVGFMPITHESPAFRRSVVHSFGGWNSSSIIAENGSKDFGINGAVYTPDSINYLRYAASSKFKHTRKFDILRLFYASQATQVVHLSINDTIRNNLVLAPSATPTMAWAGVKDIRKLQITIPHESMAVFYGVSLEDSTGVYVDNFSIKGNSGLGLLAIPTDNLLAFDRLLNYDLIVLQFGLNAVNSDTRVFKSYIEGMSQLINKFEFVFPDTPILLVSVSDRSERLQGEYVTMRSIKALVKAQEALALKHEILFWNLYQAMGGENSMVDYVNAQPPLANKDYTHSNFIGGKHIGHKLARSLIFEGKRYGERRKVNLEN